MLILTIVLAAFAPLMTKRKTVDLSSPWRYASNNSDIYYGMGDKQSAMIGQNSKKDNDLDSRLVISTKGDNQPHITFKKGSTNLGNLIISAGNFILGGPYTSSNGFKVGGSYNTGFGHNALLKLAGDEDLGHYNTAFGYNALSNTEEGYANTAVGSYALSTFDDSDTGSNTAVGHKSLEKTTTGTLNTAVGAISLQYNTIGSSNIAIGYNSLSTNKFSSNNLAIGNSAMYSNNTENKFGTTSAHNGEYKGSYNTAIGHKALYSNTNGYQNMALGYGALYSNTTGVNNVALGYNSLYSNTTSGSNIAVGASALYNNQLGENNVAIGSAALYNQVGKNAAPNPLSQPDYVGSRNTAIGHFAMYKPVHSVDNVAVGYEALYSMGKSTGAKPDGGNGNVAVGSEALYKNIANYNVAVGYKALNQNTDGDFNVAIGNGALTKNSTGTANIAVGSSALNNNTTGEGNIAVGAYSLQDNTTGSHNTAIGDGACLNVQGSNKTCIGADSGPASSTDSDDIANNDTKAIYLGDSSTTVYIPGNLVVTGTVNMGYLGYYDNTYKQRHYYVFQIQDIDLPKSGDYGSETDPGRARVALLTAPNFSTNFTSSKWWSKKPPYVKTFLYQGSTGSSDNLRNYDDGELRYEVFDTGYYADNSNAGRLNMGDYSDLYLYPSDKRLKNIKGENKAGLEQIRQLKVFDYTFKKDKEKTPHVGVIAQDLEKVFPKAVKKGEDGYLFIRQEDMFYAVINAVKQLDKLVQGIINELKIIELKLDTLIKQETAKDKKIQALEKDNANMKKEIADINKRLKNIEKP